MTTTRTGLLRVASIVIVGGISCVGAGCGDSKVVPQNMVGSYIRTEPTMMGLMRATANLEVTTTGLTARSSGVASSVLFKSVSCSGGGNVCKFVSSDDRCDGTITRDDVGDVTIIASGICATPLAGKWLGSKSAATVVPTGPILH